MAITNSYLRKHNVSCCNERDNDVQLWIEEAVSLRNHFGLSLEDRENIANGVAFNWKEQQGKLHKAAYLKDVMRAYGEYFCKCSTEKIIKKTKNKVSNSI